MPAAAASLSENTPLTSIIRSAYHEGDVEKSRAYHEARGDSHDVTEAGHQTEGGKLKPIIFGGLDGILTSFAIVAGAAGGKLPAKVVLILGVSNIFADALSMGVGEFLSSKATNEWILTERSREEWEMDNYPEGEIQEMIQIYENKGVGKADAEMVIRTLAKYKPFFVDLMMTQELELQVPEEDHVQESVREGFTMFCSFAFFGALPLLGYAIIPAQFPHLNEDALFHCACVVTGCVLFLLGSVKSFFSSLKWYRAGMETLLLGGCCATVAFTLGKWVQMYLGDEDTAGLA